MFTCTDVYIAAFMNCTPDPDGATMIADQGLQLFSADAPYCREFNASDTADGGSLFGVNGSGHYVGFDGGSYEVAGTEYETPMIDIGVLADVCTPISYLYGANKEIYTTTVTGDPLNGGSVEIEDDEGGDAELPTIYNTDDDNRRRLLAIQELRADFNNAWQKAQRRHHRSSERRLLEAVDCEENENDCYDATTLPEIDGTCDELANNMDGQHDCSSKTFEWSCAMTDPAGVADRMRMINILFADDCWSSSSYEVGVQPFFSQCEGAPEGPQNCTFTPLAAGEYATGLTITVEGDQCTACSLKTDFCPAFFDIHSCRMDWEGVTTTAPDVNTTFAITYVINAADSMAAPSQLFTVLLAMAVVLRSWI